MQRFKDVKFIERFAIEPSICFSCDDIYFLKYGQYNLQSCIKNNQLAHCHIINPSVESINVVNQFSNYRVSFSLENNSFINCNSYQIKTYYYCSRFYLAKSLFEKTKNSHLWITDTDVIFNEILPPLTTHKLSVEYNSKESCLWRKTTGNIIFIHRDKKIFLDQVIQEYETRYEELNFLNISEILPTLTKREKGNLIGLDQVSMAAIIEKHYLHDVDFINLSTIKNIKGKFREGVKVWIPVGKAKSQFQDEGFKNIKIN